MVYISVTCLWDILQCISKVHMLKKKTLNNTKSVREYIKKYDEHKCTNSDTLTWR